MKTAIYARKSTVDAKRPGKSVADQLREAREECARRGWDVVAELSDDGISASRHARSGRPGFRRLVALVESGAVGAVVCAEQSRLSRRLSEIGSLLELAAENDVLLVMGGRDVDTDDPMSWMLAGVQAGHDAGSSEDTRKRVLRGIRGAALAGRQGGRPALGYRRVYDPATGALRAVEIDPAEAAVIRDSADALLAGASLRQVTLRASERLGRELRAVNFRRTLCNPLYIAKRVHQGKVVGDGDWPPILTEAQHEGLRAMFSNGEGERLGARKHLLSGTAKCWACGKGLYAQPRGKRRVYCCQWEGCHRTVVPGDALDLYVTEAVLARLSDPRSAAAIREAWAAGADRGDGLARLRELRERIGELAELVASGEMTPRLAAASEQRIMAEIEGIEASLAPAALPPAVAAAVAGDVRSAWEGLGIEARIALIRAVAPVVTVGKALKVGERFNAARVAIEWVG